MWKRLYKKLAAILLKIADILEEGADYEIGETRRRVEQKRQEEQRNKRIQSHYKRQAEQEYTLGTSDTRWHDGRPVINHLYEDISVIANKHADDMERAIKEVELLRKGLSEYPDVMIILEGANELLKIDLNKGANRIEGPLIVPIVECQYNREYIKNENFIIGVFDNIKSAESAVKSFSTLALSHRAIFSGEPYIDAIVDIKYIQYDNPKDVGNMVSDPSLINKSIAEEKIGHWDTIPW
jgi:hypothetical protein